MQYRDDIDGLRAVAVILIVFFHVRLSNVPGGFIGVDVFFVISGFLITSLILRETAEERFTFKDFYLRRLRRLGPALLVTIALTLLAGWFILPPTLYQATAQAALATLLSVSNIFFWQQTGYFDNAAAYKPLLHTWSLAVEEQFYFIWPAALVIAARYLSKADLLAAMITLSLISLGLSQMLLGDHASAAFYFTPFRIFAFGSGAVLALTGWEARNVITANIASLSGLLIILFVAGTMHETAPFPGLNGAIPVVATALMIYAGPTAIMNRAIALPPIRYIGRISYSVYLLHWPLIIYFIFLFGQAQTSLQVLGLIALTLAAGAIMYHLIEVPFRHKRSGQFVIGSRQLARTSLLAGLIIALVSWQIHANRGYPSRYTAEIRALFATLDTALDERMNATGEFTCNATENSRQVYFDVFADCLPAGSDRLIVVLGDSHAADIYVGLNAVFPDHNIVQLTGNGCNLAQPVSEKVFCAPFIAFWQTWLTDNAARISAVIYSQSGGSLIARGAGGIERPNAAEIERLSRTLVQLQTGDAPLIFWGPRPRFRPIIDIAMAGSTDSESLRNFYADTDFRSDDQLDRKLERHFSNTAIHYVSSFQPICQQYCPTLTADGQLYILDNGHWTVAGARQAVQDVIRSDNRLQTVFAR
ncbi:hypothetical protein AL073_02445 [Loktanella sp. 1ANDIMAR09]|nr:hypothetical protein AL073_02445 [Loktanella sp. 1ANDIMAR09]